ncbi:unnamed protein product [Rotaria sordida]|uniref:Uncharacterized protein n=1 Tax=Rotaria sordida TaxID=392033 RepID=A0A814MYI6_9BILA|nr:unnamed protein product [Rotaria sordida]
MTVYEISGQPHLAKQSLAEMDPNQLSPLTPEVISRQATINIGIIGHVAHGKSTVVKCLSGAATGRFKIEKAAEEFSNLRNVIFQDDQDRKQRMQVSLDAVKHVFTNRIGPRNCATNLSDVWGALKEKLRGHE